MRWWYCRWSEVNRGWGSISLLQNSPAVLFLNSDDESEPETKRSKGNEQVDISSIRSKLQKTKTKEGHKLNSLEPDYREDIKESEPEIDIQKRKREEIKREIMELQREMKGIKSKKARENQIEPIDNDSKVEQIVEEKNDMLVSFHQEQEKYATKKVSKKGKSREDQTMALLAKFKAKLGKSYINVGAELLNE